MDRRTSLKLLAASGAASFLPRSTLAQGARASSSLDPYAYMRWGRGFEGQRRADLGNGTFLNPVFAGDHPDPSILRNGGPSAGPSTSTTRGTIPRIGWSRVSLPKARRSSDVEAGIISSPLSAGRPGHQ